MKKISLKDIKNSLKRDEMRIILGGSGSGNCKVACQIVNSSSECCGGMAVSGNYPPCPGSGGHLVCL